VYSIYVIENKTLFALAYRFTSCIAPRQGNNVFIQGV